MYVFIQVSPVEQRFDKVIGITTNKDLVDRVKDLVDSNQAFRKSFTRLDSGVIHDITYQDKLFITEINNLLESNLDWVDELIIQRVKEI